MAILLGAFVVLMFAITIAKMSDQPVTSAGRSATRASALRAGAVRGGDARPRLRLGAALPHVLPGDRLRRHDDARRGRAGRGRRPDRRALRRQYRSPTLPWQFEPAQAHGPDPARRADDRSTTARPTTPRAGRPGDGDLQRHARAQAGQIFQQDRMLLLHRADAEARRERRACRWSSSSTPSCATTRPRGTSTRSP